MHNTVPILITCDIDPTPEVPLKEKQHALDATIELFDRYDIKATFYFGANYAKLYDYQINQLSRYRHEIGCHGLTHGLEEEYNRMSEDIQRKYLTEATNKLEDLTGNVIRCFRGPRVKTSNVTQKILEELDYWVDSSVCSQRIDLISSN
ncbi:MAG: polysaccharide deacetylase family protein, partial [Candidatus Hodarchaeota archaeon]